MIKKTLGGDRLGSGKKMDVELHGYARSTHDLSYIWRSTMSSGTLVPFISEVALPGDTFDIDLDVDIKTHPTVGPLFGSFKVQLDVFEAPLRLYNAFLHNNKLKVGMNMSSMFLPRIELHAVEPDLNALQDLANSQTNPSSIFPYLGLRGAGYVPNSGIGIQSADRQFNGVPWLAYWEIYKNYYANKQEEVGAVVHAELVTRSIDIVNFSWGGTLLPARTTGTNATIVNFNNSALLEILFDENVGATTSLDWLLDNILIYGGLQGRNYQPLRYFLDMPTLIIDPATTIYVSTKQLGLYQVQNWGWASDSQVIQGPPKVRTFPLDHIDKMRDLILAWQDTVNPFVINTEAETAMLQPYMWVNWRGGVNPLLNSQEGLGIKTYQSDLFNNWLSTEWIDGVDGITEITAIDTSGGSFTIDTLNLSKKVYDMLNRIAVSGGSYYDWVGAVYDHEPFMRAESPIYHGGLIKELIFQEVVSNSGAAPVGVDGQPLGTLAGKGVMARKHKGGSVTIRVSEPAYIIGIISLTPRVDYSQGNKWDMHLMTMDDLHKPALDEIGFQELITEQMLYTSTVWNSVSSSWVTKSAGKQPAWINYMTNVNRTFGNFAIEDNEMFMTLNRRYEWDFAEEEIKDLTTYIDPVKFNFIFADTSLDAQNFWAQIAVDMIARRKLSAKVMPNL